MIYRKSVRKRLAADSGRTNQNIWRCLKTLELQEKYALNLEFRNQESGKQKFKTC